MDGISDFVDDDVTEQTDLKVMTVEYTEGSVGTIVHLFCRDGDGNRKHIEVSGHSPSFFIHKDEYNERIDNHYAVVKIETHDDGGQRYTSLYDDPLVRVYTELPEQVSEMCELFSQTWEADVFYDKRFLIDTDIYTGVRIDTSDAVTDEPWVRGDMRVDVEAVQPLDLEGYK